MKLMILSTFVLLAACSSTQSSVESGSEGNVAHQQFEAVKSLAGDWEGSGGMGDQSHPMRVTYRVTSGGSAIEERLFPGEEHEMITMYYMDGPRFVMTHYCSAGNQPHMVAMPPANESAGPGTTIEWQFVSATNLASPEAMHMHSVKQVIDGQDKLHETWIGYVDGKPAHTADFDLHRLMKMQALGYAGAAK